MNQLSKVLFKIYLYLKNRFDPRPPVTQEEIFCTDICLKLIADEDVKLTYAPISNKRFIKSEAHNMFVVLDNRLVNLINHVYGYTIYIEDTELYERITSQFDGVLEQRRQALEDEMRNNIQHSLKNILDKIS